MLDDHARCLKRLEERMITLPSRLHFQDDVARIKQRMPQIIETAKAINKHRLTPEEYAARCARPSWAS